MIEALLRPRVALAGGGHMMIEPTRALVAVDVNTGPDTSPAASLKANIAAARDLPRAAAAARPWRAGRGGLRADAQEGPRQHRTRSLRAAFKADGETSLAGWTPLGLYELTRKRDRLPLRRDAAMTCPICKRRRPHPDYRPFCSRRCADVDLGRWLTGSYAHPGGGGGRRPKTPPREPPEDPPDRH